MKQTVLFSDGSVVTLASKIADPYPVWVRLPHDTERVNIDLEKDAYIPNSSTPTAHGVIRKVVREGGHALPEVYRFYPFHSVLLTEPLQRLFYGINTEISKLKWRSLLGTSLAFTNNSSGLGGTSCHADYINQRDLNCTPPSFDIARFTGGAIVKARKASDRYYIKTVITSGKLPTIPELLASSCWFYATSISPTGRIQFIQRLGLDGTLKKVRIPLFTEQEVYLPADEVHTLGTYQKIEPNILVYK